MLQAPALQDLIAHNHCFGCGPGNERGLRLKSYWTGTGPSTARFVPQAHHCAGPPHFVNGGIIATLLDCHGICTAIAAAHFDAGRALGSAPALHYVTASLRLTYARPTPLSDELVLLARPVRTDERRYAVAAELHAGGKVCVTAEVEAVQVPESWMRGG